MKRLFRVIKSWFNKTVDELEDPILMAEQSIRELKNNLQSCYDGLAQVKAQKLIAVREKDEAKEESEGYLKQASWIKNKSGKPEEEKELAVKEALKLKIEADSRIKASDTNIAFFEKLEKDINTKISKLKKTISDFERELTTLKIKDKMNKVSSNVRLSTSSLNYESSISTLKRMKEKIDEEYAIEDAHLEVEKEHSDMDLSEFKEEEELERLYNQL